MRGDSFQFMVHHPLRGQEQQQRHGRSLILMVLNSQIFKAVSSASDLLSPDVHSIHPSFRRSVESKMLPCMVLKDPRLSLE